MAELVLTSPGTVIKKAAKKTNNDNVFSAVEEESTELLVLQVHTEKAQKQVENQSHIIPNITPGKER